jgi:hypothetical protein
MITTGSLKKTFSLLIVCCFLSSIHLSQARALEQQEGRMCAPLDTPLFEELAGQLLYQGEHTSDAPISAEDLATISPEQFDVAGFIVLYNIFMFIFYGRQCLGTLDPEPCESMVKHLVLALFLGILLEGV